MSLSLSLAERFRSRIIISTVIITIPLRLFIINIILRARLGVCVGECVSVLRGRQCDQRGRTTAADT